MSSQGRAGRDPDLPADLTACSRRFDRRGDIAPLVGVGGRASRDGRLGAARATLLSAAAARFYEQGVARTGIDVITADAGVAKMSLYNDFASTTELVAAYLEQRQQWFRDLLRTGAEALPTGAGREGADGVRRRHRPRRRHDGFRGCGLLNVAGELTTGDATRAQMARHKDEVEALLPDALGPRRDDPPGPVVDVDVLAEHLANLLEGAAVRAGLDGDAARLHRARASDLIGASSRPAARRDDADRPESASTTGGARSEGTT